MVLLFSRPLRFTSCSCTCGRCPWFADRPGFPVVAQRLSLMVQTCSGPKCFLDARHVRDVAAAAPTCF